MLVSKRRERGALELGTGTDILEQREQSLRKLRSWHSSQYLHYNQPFPVNQGLQ